MKHKDLINIKVSQWFNRVKVKFPNKKLAFFKLEEPFTHCWRYQVFNKNKCLAILLINPTNLEIIKDEIYEENRSNK